MDKLLKELTDKFSLYNYNKELDNFTTCHHEVAEFIQSKIIEVLEEAKRELEREYIICEEKRLNIIILRHLNILSNLINKYKI